MDFKISSVKKFVLWFISKFTYDELLFIFSFLFDILFEKKEFYQNKFKKVLPKEYRKFYPNSLAPIINKSIFEHEHYSSILSKNNIKPVKSKNPVISSICCPYCKAPSNYLYYNNGIKKSQIKCKCCNHTFSSKIPNIADKREFYCPYCKKKLYTWKKKKSYFSYKCMNDNCSFHINTIKSFSKVAKKMYKINPDNFKTRYNYKHYFIDYQYLSTKNCFDYNIKNINNPDLIGLIFSLRITFKLSLRDCVLALYNLFNINISHQSILNYQNMYAYIFQKFNTKYSKLNSSICSADETYIKISGKQHYLYFAIDCFNKNIFADNLSNDREFHDCYAFYKDICNNSNMDSFDFITDGCPSYQAVINQSKVDNLFPNVNHVKVIGLQNLDKTSKEYRAYKQIIERFNRTFKSYYKIQTSFKSFDGALNYIPAFIINYNFIRPHSSINNKAPVNLNFLQNIDKIPDKWIAIIKKGIELN
jgi:transposase-like protein/uncharacterized protein YbaR (Trm112 family)